MSHIMSEDKLQEQMVKLIQGILGLYRKGNEPHVVTQVSVILI